MVLRTDQTLDPVFEAAEAHLVNLFPVRLFLTLIDESLLWRTRSQPEQGLRLLYVRNIQLHGVTHSGKTSTDL